MLTTDTTPATVATSADFIGPVQPVADATPAKPAKPARAKRAAKPATPPVVADKPVSLAKPGTDNAAADAEAQRLRDLAAKYYNGASLAAHQRKPAKRDEYASRVAKPVQRIGGSGPSPRDESGLALILSAAKRDGTFDPVALNLDLGILSRLASVAFVAFDSDTFKLTKPGRERANLVAKRAA